MINEADYAKYKPEAKPNRKPTLIDKANEVVDIRDVYNEMQRDNKAPTGSYGSWKIYCPFGYEHADGGMDKNCRLYPPTHIYCWATHGTIRPVYLFSRWKGMRMMDAAEYLLDERGLLKKLNWREQWNELTQEREDKHHARLGSQSYAISALQEACHRLEGYSEREYDEDVRELWLLVLAKLDQLWQNSTTDVSVLTQWFNTSVARMERVLNERIA